MAEQILTKKRSHIKSRLTRFVTFLNECNDNEEKRQETAVRLERVESVWKDFDAVQTELEDLIEAEIESGEHDSFENKFYQSITRAKNIISTLQTFRSKSNKLKSQINILISLNQIKCAYPPSTFLNSMALEKNGSHFMTLSLPWCTTMQCLLPLTSYII